MDRLEASLIRQHMAPARWIKLSQLTVLPEVDSTNTAVARLPGDRQHAHAVLAEQQTVGRGRRQRNWHSPAGGNIYLSLGWWFRESNWPLSTLPLVVAIAVCRALGRAGLQGHGIKWPNDILIDGKKLAGILVELQSSGRGPALAIIGTGLNIRMPESSPGELKAAIDRPWTDLAAHLENEGAAIDRNHVAALLLEELPAALELFERDGFEPLRSTWQELDVLQGNKIVLDQDGTDLPGIVRGVDGNGSLLLETAPSVIQTYHSGEVSIHRG